MNVFQALFAAILFPAFVSGQQAGSNDRPNIIFILADDLGYGDISVFNENSRWETPHIDGLAQSGMRFTDAHTSSAVCTPTRYSIITGRYNWRSTLKAGVLGGYSTALIKEERMTVADMMKAKHYQTAFIGKWHLGWNWQFKGHDQAGDDLDKNPRVDFSKPIKNGPKEQGFMYSYGFSGSLDMPPYVYVENGMTTRIPHDTTVSVDDKGFWRKGITAPDFDHATVLQHLTDKSVDYIGKQATEGTPFFLYFALPAPHTPILPSTEFIGKSNANFYGDFVLQVDDVVGQVIAALKDKGIYEHTLIIFTSDNGCSPKANYAELAKVGHDPSYIYRGHKADIYEGGHRVPFIVSWPAKVRKGSTSDEIICTTDFMATAADMLNYTIPDNAGEDSYSFLPVLLEGKRSGPLREATVHHSINGSFAIRQGEWKLALCPGSGGWSAPRPGAAPKDAPEMQLYNLRSDPQEQHNLIAENPEKASALKALLSGYIKNGRSTPGAAQKNDGPETWKQLSWME